MFAQAAVANPQDLRARTNWAYCLIKEGRKSEAEQLLEDVLARDPGFGPAAQNLKALRQGQ